MQNNEHFEFLFLLIRYIEYKQQHFQLERQTIINFNSTDYDGFKNYFVRDNVRLFVTILENVLTYSLSSATAQMKLNALCIMVSKSSIVNSTHSTSLAITLVGKLSLINCERAIWPAM